MSDDPAITVVTSDGLHLEAELYAPPDPWARAVVCHPHPSYGGSMSSTVNRAMVDHLVEVGAAVLHFNFRGVGRSSGAHDDGRGERLDVEAAVEHLAAATPAVPLVLSGWSFGADICTAVDHDAVSGWFLVAAPLAVVPAVEMVCASSPKPKHLAVPAHDQFRSPDEARSAVAEWPATTVEVVPGVDHFLIGGAAAVSDSLEYFARAL